MKIGFDNVQAVCMLVLVAPAVHAFTSTTTTSFRPTTLSFSAITQQPTTFLAARARTVVKQQQQSKFARRQVIVAGWGPDPIWETCTVLSNTPNASKNCCIVNVSVTDEQLKDYRVPGQYLQMKVAGDDNAKPFFLAMANPPADAEAKEGAFEFLIKKTDNNAWVFDLANGDKVDCSQVLGNGFPIEENLEGHKYDFPTQNVILLATGTGIAPIKAAIESGQLGVEGSRTCRLYYGNRTPEEVPYADKFAAWEAKGVEVVPVISQPEGTNWDGRTGYVQTALEEDGIPIPRNSGALLCGQKEMADAAKALLSSAGVFEGRMLTNF